MKVVNYWGCVVKKSCLCGCGQLIPAFSRDGKLQFFVVGHAARLQSGIITGYKKGHPGMVGDKHPRFKGGWYDRGYHILSKNKKRYEHRDTYEKYYKCCILPYVDIHHKNKDKKDNRIENLKPMYKAKHSKLHYQKLKIDKTTGRFVHVD